MPDDPTTSPIPELPPKPPLGALFDLGFNTTPNLASCIIWQPPTVEQLQAVLPQYEITAFVARGGMGAVYKGVQKALKRSVAIKVLPPEIEQVDVDYAERFKREAQAMAQLSHPGIVAVHDAGETPSGFLYFVMEFIEGSDVAQLLTREGKLDPTRALKITADVLEALGFAHESGIIHRDVKPSNMMLDARGRVKVADFGLAKVISQDDAGFTRSDLALGTADFIAPEALIPGTKVDARADVYAVGVMLYQMLTGKIPRGSFDLPSGVVEQLDPRIDAIVLKAMKTDREKRYASAAEMMEALAAVTPGTTITTAHLPPADVTTATQKDLGTRACTSSFIAAALVLTLGIGAFSLFHRFQPASEAEALKLSGVSPSPAPQVSQSSAIYPPGQWVKLWPLLTKDPNLPEDLRGKLNALRERDGWIEPPQGNSIPLFDPRTMGHNAAIRATFRFVGDLKFMPQLALRGTAASPRVGYLGRLNDSGSRLIATIHDERGNKTSANETWFEATKRPSKSPAAGDAYTLQLAVVGQHLMAWCNGELLVEADDAKLTEGLAGLFIGEAFRDAEFLNLDGLPEAEALKLAGVAGAPQQAGKK